MILPYTFLRLQKNKEGFAQAKKKNSLAPHEEGVTHHELFGELLE